MAGSETKLPQYYQFLPVIFQQLGLSCYIKLSESSLMAQDPEQCLMVRNLWKICALPEVTISSQVQYPQKAAVCHCRFRSQINRIFNCSVCYVINIRQYLINTMFFVLDVGLLIVFELLESLTIFILKSVNQATRNLLNFTILKTDK